MAGNYKDDKFKVPTEAELEAMLDTDSDEDFGQTELEVASVDKRAVLKEWTAQDFANIYTRFRPHLERHARRFLRNPSQVDEVVQDAFLYLMVTLPELDSELGVLRFLKWKVRLLSLDVIRASGKAYIMDIDEHSATLRSDDHEPSNDLERAEDAAIVRLALAKLQPRHREVLIASIYEEKSTLEIAGQVGLSENATRQLMLRARKSLKKALVGEVDTKGLSINQILSVAARKAANDAKRVGAQALSLIAISVLGVAAFLNINNLGSPVNLVASDEPLHQRTQDTTVPLSQGKDSASPPSQAVKEVTGSEPRNMQTADTTNPQVFVTANTQSQAVEEAQAVLLSKTGRLLGSNLTNASIAGGSRAPADFQTNFEGYGIQIFIAPDASAFAALNLETGEIESVLFEVRTEEGYFYGYPRTFGAAVSVAEGGYTSTFVARQSTFLDSTGRVVAGNALELATISITIDLNRDFSPKFASLSILP